MRIKLKIRTKLLLSILTVTAIVYAALMGYMSINLQSLALKDAMEIANTSARENANLTKANINVDMIMTRSLAHSFVKIKEIPKKQQVETINRALEGVALENREFLSVWVNFELNTLDSAYPNSYGRKRHTYWWENNELRYKEEILNVDGDVPTGAYYKMKVSKEETVLDPYWFSYLEGSKPILEASVCLPVIEDDKFLGVFGLDLSLERFQPIVEGIKPFEKSIAFLVANDGSIVAHPNKELIGKNLYTYSLPPTNISVP